MALRAPVDSNDRHRLDETKNGFVYPLFGRHFERKVVIVAAATRPASSASSNTRREVRYVLAKAGKPLDRALRSEPADYTLVRRQGAQRIYRVDRGDLDGSVEVEAVEVHDLVPRRDEVADELLLRSRRQA